MTDLHRINIDEAPQDSFQRFARSAVNLGENPPQVEETGGRYDSGIIRNVSVITQGEALGHGLWCDSVMLDQVVEQGNEYWAGLKARFTHPGMSSDGLGRMLGRVHDFRREGDQVIADLHFSESSHSTPEGDLAEYVMLLASEDGEAAGLSIVFEHDFENQEAFIRSNLDDDGEFSSPDEANLANLPHARIDQLRAADVVDEPAANPSGMFYRNDVPSQAFNFFDYVVELGGADKPGALFGIDADRARAFFQRWKDERNFTLSEASKMEPENISEASENDEPQAPQETRASVLAELSKFTERFGNDNGVAWFNDGIGYNDALGKHLEQLEEKLAEKTLQVGELKLQLESLSLGEDEPVGVPSEESKKTDFASMFRVNTASAN